MDWALRLGKGREKREKLVDLRFLWCISFAINGMERISDHYAPLEGFIFQLWPRSGYFFAGAGGLCGFGVAGGEQHV
ncbi:hypothetical protein KDAU_46660 [Dictyobacter aurantiacus]|uniref:Uncharacterized protein n=1 Tax=Dictyobacter aurantiacus TaxID=1936993 RepID=A0A401ZKD9_9CHLR|nr:hypothetical protein KDAU_46660 [Dictyobacter aurantiacus]